MAESVAHASGKLMLAGEYAVLFEPGRCMAIAVGELATARWSAASTPTLTLDAYDTVRSWPLTAIPTEQLMGFVGAAIAAAGHGRLPEGGLHVRVTGQRQGRKFGLGSSAATTIAVLRATLVALGETTRPARIMALAHAIHHAQQGGRGSGYDVATIAHGGCVAYERTSATVRQLSWPSGVFGAALYTGTPSSTVAALRRGIDATTPGIAAIAAASDDLRLAWTSGAATPILRALATCEAAFDSLAADHPWMTPESLQRARTHIRQHGGVARTSGAGGGDCVLAWTDDRDRRDAIVAAWPEACVARLPEDLAAVEAP